MDEFADRQGHFFLWFTTCLNAFFNEDPWNLDLTLSSVSSLCSQLLGYYGLLVLNPEVCSFLRVLTRKLQ